MLLKIFIVLIMFVGLGFTLVPRIPGTIIILLAALLYGEITGFNKFNPLVWTSLIALTAIAEVGGRWLRRYLTQKYTITRLFSTNSIVANFGGIVAADALLGPMLGLIIWELIAGATLESRLKAIGDIVSRLFLAAALRFCCGLIMIFIAINYLLS